MELMLLRRFQSEIELQCKFVMLAANTLDEQINALQSATRPRDHAPVWFCVQGILIAASNIAKLLWGSGGKREDERKALHESIGIDSTSPLHAPRLRDEFEHIDERLDHWYREDPNHNFVGRIIGPANAVHIEGGIPQQRFGSFDPATGRATFWDHEESILDIVREVQRIFPAVQREAAKPHWEP